MIVTISWRGNIIGNSALYPQEKAKYKILLLSSLWIFLCFYLFCDVKVQSKIDENFRTNMQFEWDKSGDVDSTGARGKMPPYPPSNTKKKKLNKATYAATLPE